MQRFFYPFELTQNLIIEDHHIIHQMMKVLRARVGDEVIFFDNQLDVIYELEEIQKRQLRFTKQKEIKKEKKCLKQINLFQAQPNKLDKIELILQKGTEVGVSNFYFFLADRSQSLHISENKLDRFYKIIIEAVEQSGSNTIPGLHFLDTMDFGELVDTQTIYFHTKSENSSSLPELELKEIESVNLLVGPEGGFSEEEIDNFKTNKFTGVHLGEQILRTETCAIVTSFFIKQLLCTNYIS